MSCGEKLRWLRHCQANKGMTSKQVNASFRKVYPVEFVRVALNMDQIDQYDPPPFAAKQTSSRFQSYMDEHNTDNAWELDALDPMVLRELIRKHVEELFDYEVHHTNVELITEWREDMMERNAPDFIGCEVFAFQSMYKIWLEEEIAKRGLNFMVQEVGRDSKKKKFARIEALQPKISQGKLLFRHVDKPVIDELLLWDPKSKTNDDDLIDALAWQVGLWSRPYGDDVEPVDDAPPGSFNEALEQMRADRSGHYLVKLFEDMGSQ